MTPDLNFPLVLIPLLTLFLFISGHASTKWNCDNSFSKVTIVLNNFKIKGVKILTVFLLPKNNFPLQLGPIPPYLLIDSFEIVIPTLLYFFSELPPIRKTLNILNPNNFSKYFKLITHPNRDHLLFFMTNTTLTGR